MVWRNGLITKLIRKGASGLILKWLNAFQRDRSFCLRVGGSQSREFTLENGIPEGSVHNSLLFAMMMDELPQNNSFTAQSFHGRHRIMERKTAHPRLT